MLVEGWSWHQREHGRRSWSGLRSRPCGERWHEHLRGRSPVADRGMRPDGVVVPSPTLDDDLGLAQHVEDLAVEQLVAQARIEALDEAVLPWTARGDVGGLCADGADPILHGLGDKLRAVVGTDGLGDAAQNEQVRNHTHDHGRLHAARYPNGQALVGELVDDVEHTELPSIMGALLDKVVGPHVVRALGSQPDAGSVIQPQACALRLPRGDLQPLAPPDPLDPLVVDQPAGPAQQLGDLAIAVAAIPPGQLDNVGGQLLFILTAPRHLALRRAMLPERGTGPALGNRQRVSNMLDAGAATRGA